MIDVQVFVQVDGRRVPPTQLADVLETAAWKALEEGAKNLLGNVSCAVHDTPSVVVIEGDRTDKLTFRTERMCCEALAKDVVSRLQPG